MTYSPLYDAARYGTGILSSQTVTMRNNGDSWHVYEPPKSQKCEFFMLYSDPVSLPGSPEDWERNGDTYFITEADMIAGLSFRYAGAAYNRVFAFKRTWSNGSASRFQEVYLPIFIK